MANPCSRGVIPIVYMSLSVIRFNNGSLILQKAGRRYQTKTEINKETSQANNNPHKILHILRGPIKSIFLTTLYSSHSFLYSNFVQTYSICHKMTATGCVFIFITSKIFNKSQSNRLIS